MTSNDMKRAIEIDGPNAPCVSDGFADNPYITLSIKAGDACGVIDLAKQLDCQIEAIRKRVDVIVWRVRPALAKSDQARLSLRCRLATYPPLSSNDIESISVCCADAE